MDRKTAQDWLDPYVQAWRSYDPEDVARLFSETVAYRYHPLQFTEYYLRRP